MDRPLRQLVSHGAADPPAPDDNDVWIPVQVFPSRGPRLVLPSPLTPDPSPARGENARLRENCLGSMAGVKPERRRLQRMGRE